MTPTQTPPILKSYAAVQAYLFKIFTDAKAPGGSNVQRDAEQRAPHGAFWSTMSYQQFVTGNVPSVRGSMPILIKGNSAQSNIVMALRGTPGSPFDPKSGRFRRMPTDGAEYFTEEVIAPLAGWIDAGCPENAST